MVEIMIDKISEDIVDTIRESLLVLDQDLRVVTVSRSFYEFFKVKPEETMGQLIYDLGNKQWDIPKLRELLENILPEKTAFDNYEVEHEFATIGHRIMLLNARQIERGIGKERIILLAIEDITERKKTEAGLEKAHEALKKLTDELKHVAKAKSEFLANMSHELRTPLNSINGFSEVLYDETFGSLNKKQKQYINNVLTSGKHLLLLINQILDMAKVESGKMNLVLSSLPIKGLLNEISLLVEDMVGKKKIKLLLEIAEDLPNIEADDLKVREILYNLLSNAVWVSTARADDADELERLAQALLSEDRQLMYYYIAQPIKDDQKNVLGVAYIVAHTNPIEQAIQRMVANQRLATYIALACASLVALVLALTMTRRLRSLMRETHAFAAGSKPLGKPPRGGDEIFHRECWQTPENTTMLCRLSGCGRQLSNSGE